jgi:hypothetical protein
MHASQSRGIGIALIGTQQGRNAAVTLELLPPIAGCARERQTASVNLPAFVPSSAIVAEKPPSGRRQLVRDAQVLCRKTAVQNVFATVLPHPAPTALEAATERSGADGGWTTGENLQQGDFVGPGPTPRRSPEIGHRDQNERLTPTVTRLLIASVLDAVPSRAVKDRPSVRMWRTPTSTVRFSQSW